MFYINLKKTGKKRGFSGYRDFQKCDTSQTIARSCNDVSQSVPETSCQTSTTTTTVAQEIAHQSNQLAVEPLCVAMRVNDANKCVRSPPSYGHTVKSKPESGKEELLLPDYNKAVKNNTKK